jgi:hypothetical protein
VTPSRTRCAAGLLACVAMLLTSSASSADRRPYASVIDPADFVPVVDHPFSPLVPGTTRLYGDGVPAAGNARWMAIDWRGKRHGTTCLTRLTARHCV